jgi:hypothetical protein
MKENVAKGFGIVSLVVMALLFYVFIIPHVLPSLDISMPDSIVYCLPFVALILAAISVYIRRGRIGIIGLCISGTISIAIVFVAVLFFFTFYR